MQDIRIPEARAARHGGADFYNSGLKWTETLVLWGQLKATDSVLDVGCGPGRMAIGIGQTLGSGVHYLGLDVIETDVVVAREAITSQFPSFRFAHLDAFNGLYNPKGTMAPDKVTFPVSDASTDFVFAASLFTHMFDLEVGRYLGEMARVLRPGGRLLTSWFILSAQSQAQTATGKARFGFPHRRDDGTFVELPDRPEEVVAFTDARVRQLFNQAGFDVTAFHQGSWPRLALGAKPRHSQDVYVCVKR